MRVYRKKYVIHIDKITRTKANGSTVHIGIHPSNVIYLLVYSLLTQTSFRFFCVLHSRKGAKLVFFFFCKL